MFSKKVNNKLNYIYNFNSKNKKTINNLNFFNY